MNPNTNTEQTRSFASFLQMLRDGAFHHECSEELRELNADMNNQAISYGGKIKGKMVITLEFLLKDGVFEISADKKIVKPKSKSTRTIAWSTDGNNFSANNPRQMQLFGIREVETQKDIITV